MRILVFLILALVLSPSAAAGGGIHVEYFGTENCLSCLEAEEHMDKVLSRFRTDYPEAHVIMERYDIRYPEDRERMEEVSEAYGIRPLVPVVIVCGTPLPTVRDIKEGFEEALLNAHAGECPSPPQVHEGTYAELMFGEYERFSLGIVLLAGFLDGLNPCALAMLMFLLSFTMSLEVKNPGDRRILYVGWIYAAATFLVYFIIGAGLFTAVLRLAFLPHMLKVIYGLTMFFCLILGVMNWFDYVQISRGRLHRVRTQLPQRMKHGLQNFMRDRVSSKALYTSVFLVSAVVSVVDFLCTGQIYLPTITFILSTDPSAWGAYLYLALYCLMFTLPILLVVYVVHLGKTVLPAAQFITQNLKYIKLAGGAFFTGLALFMARLLQLVW